MIGTRFWLLNELLKLCARAVVAYRVAIATLSGLVTLFVVRDTRESVWARLVTSNTALPNPCPGHFRTFCVASPASAFAGSLTTPRFLPGPCSNGIED